MHEHIFGIDENGEISCWCGVVEEENYRDDLGPKKEHECVECGNKFYSYGNCVCRTCSDELGIHEEDLDGDY